jgi:hypothetical protein
MDNTLQPSRRKPKYELTQLHLLSSSRPRAKIGQIVWAWQEIEVALASGWKLKQVWEAAARDGIEMSYAQFRVYVSKVRRRGVGSDTRIQQSSLVAPAIEQAMPQPADPFRNLREQAEKKRQASFEYDPFSINRDLT